MPEMQEKPDKDALIKAAVDYHAQYLNLTRGDMGVDPKSSGVEKFKKVLTTLIKQQESHNKNSGWENRVIMSTDYNPEGILRDALQQSGTWGIFPLKDRIIINDPHLKMRV